MDNFGISILMDYYTIFSENSSHSQVGDLDSISQPPGTIARYTRPTVASRRNAWTDINYKARYCLNIFLTQT